MRTYQHLESTVVSRGLIATEVDKDEPPLSIPPHKVSMFGKALFVFTVEYSNAVRRGLRNAASQKAEAERWIQC